MKSNATCATWISQFAGWRWEKLEPPYVVCYRGGMKCFNHHANDAVAVCACCGRGLCPDCVPSPAPPRIVCTVDCAAMLARNDDAIQLLLRKSQQSARASAFYCYLSSGLSAAAAIAAWFMLPAPFLIYFTGGCAVVLFVAGFWYQRSAKR